METEGPNPQNLAAPNPENKNSDPEYGKKIAEQMHAGPGATAEQDVARPDSGGFEHSSDLNKAIDRLNSQEDE